MTTAKKAPGKAAAKKSAAKKTPTKKAVAKSAASGKAAVARGGAASETSASKAKALSASDAIDEQLARYQSMRDFSVTAEPSGKAKQGTAAEPGGKLPFVVQKHAASHLHYDFRLGWNGVLKSWAVAKGPSYFTGDKRLAVQVEDHPMEYGGFEGVIPRGQYGGGTVMLWDQGTWEPQPGHTDVDAGLRDGSLKFILHGTKLKGKWALIRMGGKAANEKKPNWLLIKEHDDFERPETDTPITEVAPDSVVTGRSIEAIAKDEDHTWNSKDTAKKGRQAWVRKDQPKPAAASSFGPDLTGVPEEELPKFVPPQLASQATTPPVSKEWLHELKLDGYRIQARKEGSRVELITRSGLDWTHRMKGIAAQVALLPAERALLDGEVVVLGPDGTTSFADLQAAFQDGGGKPLTYFVFDLLHLNGHSLRKLPLVERKALLEEMLKDAGDTVRLSEHIEGSGDVIFRKACELQAEGIVSKLANGVYVSGRSSNWLKLKCVHEQEFVVGGFTLPAKGHAKLYGVGALLLGYYDDAGKLIYAGRTGTGFTEKTHAAIRSQLEALRAEKTPFANPPSELRRGAIWVKPKLVAQVRFATWTADNLVRQASFQGLREDKPAAEVRREEAMMQPRNARPQPAREVEREASHPVAAPVAARKAPAQKVSTQKAAVRKVAAEAASGEHAAVRLSHPDKVLDTESQLTKQQLADYYWAIAPYMLPHIEGRPLSLVRCPEGTAQQCFFQKHVNSMLPKGIEAVPVPDKKTGKMEDYITLATREALAGLAQIGVLEVHPWGSRSDDLEHPDRIIFDLDPDAAIAWPVLGAAALEVKQALKKLGLASFLKGTGGKGLHVVAPIEPEHDWSAVKQFAHDFVLRIEKAKPELYVTKMSKAIRTDRIYLDYLRNERGATAVAAFSPRSRPGVSVSVPLHWPELEAAERPSFHVSDFDGWKGRLGRDPWKELVELKQRLVIGAG
jgi:bifunctional non-homologous end joining protein LigD